MAQRDFRSVVQKRTELSKRHGDKCINAAAGTPDPELIRTLSLDLFLTLKHEVVQEEWLKAVNLNYHQDTGLENYVLNYLTSILGAQVVQNNQIYIADRGSQQILDETMAMAWQEDSLIGIFEPYYYGQSPIINQKYLKPNVRSILGKGKRLDRIIEEMSGVAGSQKILLIVNENPISVPVKDRIPEILNALDVYKNVTLLLDDAYPFDPEGLRLVLINAANRSFLDRIIYTGTFSKIVSGPGLGIGFALASEHYIKRYFNESQIGGLCARNPGHGIFGLYLSKKPLVAIADRCTKTYLTKHRLLMESLKPLRSYRVRWDENHAFYAWMEFPEGVDTSFETEFSKRMWDPVVGGYSLHYIPGVYFAFQFEDELRNCIRISISAVPEKLIPRVGPKIVAVLEDMGFRG
jgi:aspartate/methionine/tyrosine aminotransferase